MRARASSSDVGSRSPRRAARLPLRRGRSTSPHPLTTRQAPPARSIASTRWRGSASRSSSSRCSCLSAARWQLSPRLPGSTAAAVATALVLALCVANLQRTAADARAWDAAAEDQRQVLSDLRAALPRPARGAVIYAFDAPRVVAPGVPVLGTTLDLTSAARISYASPTLTRADRARCCCALRRARSVRRRDAGFIRARLPGQRSRATHRAPGRTGRLYRRDRGMTRAARTVA